MKNLNQLLLIIFCLFFQHLKAQNCCVVPERKKDTTFVLPKLIDTSLFVSELKNKLDLKSTYDKLERDTIMGIYMYTFDINERGELEPRLYYDINSSEMKEIQEFVVNRFNHYTWVPGYIKKCISCKATIDLQLFIYLNTDKSSVEVVIKDIETLKKIFYLFIPYKDLKSFN